MRPDGRLVFYCAAIHPSDAKWFWADSWTSTIEWVSPHLDCLSPWTTDHRTRRQFVTAALTLFLRAGGEQDGLALQGTMPDEFLRFEHLPGGDGGVLIEVSSRLSKECARCPARPLAEDHQEILTELGFALDPWDDYSSEELPPDPDRLTAITDTVFHNVYEQPEDYGILARFRAPAMAEAFYLGWTLGVPPISPSSRSDERPL